MIVEIWSDIMCPFCYIGKRRFEKAVQSLAHPEEIKIIWRSYQLNPGLKTQPNLNSQEHLAASKGWSQAQRLEITKQVTEMAAGEGLEYHLEQTVVANSFNAHRLLHISRGIQAQVALQEKIFDAYFNKGQNTDDYSVLRKIALEVGIPEEVLDRFEQDPDYMATEVHADLQTAAEIGVRGVPFFVFDRKYAITGAQETEEFINVLKQIQQESST